LAISIERGSVYRVNFEPSLGGEIKKSRLAIVVSNNAANTYLNRIQIVPITSKTDHLYPGEAYVTLNSEKRKAMADQLTTIGKLRLGAKLGLLNKVDVGRVEAAILLQLGIECS
jgi:mRNA interferase MazF